MCACVGGGVKVGKPYTNNIELILDNNAYLRHSCLVIKWKAYKKPTAKTTPPQKNAKKTLNKPTDYLALLLPISFKLINFPIFRF
jgi:hypothetical protein